MARVKRSNSDARESEEELPQGLKALIEEQKVQDKPAIALAEEEERRLAKWYRNHTTRNTHSRSTRLSIAPGAHKW